MEQVDVLAVVGACAPERLRYAKRLSAMTQRLLVSARRLDPSPDPAAEAAAIAPWADTPAGVVIEFPSRTATTELIGSLAGPDAETRLSGVVCVVDAAHLLDDLRRDSYAHLPAAPWQHPALSRHVAHAVLTVTGLEYASLVVFVNWSALPTDELSVVMALASHLAPRARLRLQREAIEPWRPGEPYAQAQERPGWVALLNDDFEPPMTDPRVSGFRYEQLRPLHPGRLQRLLDERVEPGEFGSVIRSAGFCRFATRPGIVARWDHVGRMISFDPVGRDDALGEDEDLLSVGQDLAFLGLDLDREALSAALDAAALSDDELAAGPAVWAAFPDPFPAWPAAANRAD